MRRDRRKPARPCRHVHSFSTIQIKDQVSGSALPLGPSFERNTTTAAAASVQAADMADEALAQELLSLPDGHVRKIEVRRAQTLGAGQGVARSLCMLDRGMHGRRECLECVVLRAGPRP